MYLLQNISDIKFPVIPFFNTHISIGPEGGGNIVDQRLYLLLVNIVHVGKYINL